MLCFCYAVIMVGNMLFTFFSLLTLFWYPYFIPFIAEHILPEVMYHNDYFEWCWRRSWSACVCTKIWLLYIYWVTATVLQAYSKQGKTSSFFTSPFESSFYPWFIWSGCECIYKSYSEVCASLSLKQWGTLLWRDLMLKRREAVRWVIRMALCISAFGSFGYNSFLSPWNSIESFFLCQQTNF